MRVVPPSEEEGFSSETAGIVSNCGGRGGEKVPPTVSTIPVNIVAGSGGL